MNKPRVLIGLWSDIFLRNFVQTGAFDELTKRYEVFWFVTDAVRQRLPLKEGFTDAGPVAMPRWREQVRYHLRWAAIFAGHKRCTTLALKRRRGLNSRRERFFYSLMSLPGVWPVLDELAEFCLGKNRSLEAVLDRVRPDILLFPSQGNDSLATDLLRSARRRSIPTVMLNYNWDNMTTKGPMRRFPDRLCVWGEDMAQLARQVHRLPDERLRIIGAAHFEQYFHPESMRQAASARHGFSGDASLPRLLFAGSSRRHPEMKYLQALEAAIEEGRLPKIKVVFRPHPWRTPRQGEPDFEEAGFRHIEMDPQAAEQFGQQMNRRPAEPDRTYAPPIDYNAWLLQSVAGVITPLSTLALEATLVGVPVLEIDFFEEDEWLSEALDHNEHLQRMRQEVPGIIICRDESQFLQGVQRLLSLTAEKALAARIRQAVRPVVYSEEQSTYARRLAGVVDELLGRVSSQSGAPAQAEEKPVEVCG